MKDCIFCKIINNELPSKVVYEDELIKIIMNINPNTNGHLLVIPIKHYDNLLDLDENILMHSIKIVKEVIYPKLKDKLNAKGLTLAQHNELGQEIKHFHLHLMPRYENDLTEYTYNKDLLINIDEVYDKLK